MKGGPGTPIWEVGVGGENLGLDSCSLVQARGGEGPGGAGSLSRASPTASAPIPDTSVPTGALCHQAWLSSDQLDTPSSLTLRQLSLPPGSLSHPPRSGGSPARVQVSAPDRWGHRLLRVWVWALPLHKGDGVGGQEWTALLSLSVGSSLRLRAMTRLDVGTSSD